MSIRCGNLRHSEPTYHASVAEVRECFLGKGITGVGAGTRNKPQRHDITEGMWIVELDHEPEVYKVQKAVHGSGHLYAKRLILQQDAPGMQLKATFVYAKGAMRTLAEQGRKMTLEEAKEFGALYGVCCVCGRTLTDENSIEAGIGPVCAGKFAA